VDRRSSVPAVGHRPRLNVGYGSWELIWSHVHRVLVVNVGLTTANLPLLAALEASHQPWRHPFVFVLLSVGIGPSLAAAFGYLARAGADDRPPALDYVRVYVHLLRPALLLWTPFALLACVTAADAAMLHSTAVAPAVLPALAVVALVAVSAGTLATAGLADRGGPVTRRTYLAAAYAVVRRWPLSLMNLALLALAAVMVNQEPLLGLAVLPGCVLFVVWRNACTMLPAPARQAGDAPGTD
jgi:hypothetical protein